MMRWVFFGLGMLTGAVLLHLPNADAANLNCPSCAALQNFAQSPVSVSPSLLEILNVTRYIAPSPAQVMFAPATMPTSSGASEKFIDLKKDWGLSDSSFNPSILPLQPEKVQGMVPPVLPAPVAPAQASSEVML